MASIERTAYPRFKRLISATELAEFYTPTPKEIEFAYSRARGNESILSLLVLLKSFQHLGYFPNKLKHVPLSIVTHLRTCLTVGNTDETAPPLVFQTRSLYRHHQSIRRFLGVTVYKEAAQAVAHSAIHAAAQVMNNPADLINVAIEKLVKERYELPAYSTLDTMVQRIRTQVNTELWGRVLGRISEAAQTKLASLLPKALAMEQIEILSEIGTGTGTGTGAGTETETENKDEVGTESKTTSDWARLKQLPKSATLGHFQDLLDQLDWLLTLGEVEVWLKEVPKAKIHHFAAEARSLKAAELLDYSLPKRYTLLVCVIQQAIVTTRDNLVEMFLKRVAHLHSRAKEELEAIRQRQRHQTENLLGLLTEIVQVVPEAILPQPILSNASVDEAQVLPLTTPTTTSQTADDKTETRIPDVVETVDTSKTEARLGQQVAGLVTAHGGRNTVLTQCEEITVYNADNYLPLLVRFYPSQRNTLFRLMRALDIKSTSQDGAVKTALDFILKHATSKEEFLPVEISLTFASEQWRQTVTASVEGQPCLAQRELELCVFSYLASELKCGDMAVTGSETWADYRDQLLPWVECEPMLADYCEELGFPTSAKKFVQQLKAELIRVAEEVDRNWVSDGQVTINKKGEPVLKKVAPKKASKTLAGLEAALRERLPERSVLDVLANVEHYTHFTRHFGPLSGSDPKLAQPTERYLLTTFGYGCNLGPVQTARHLRGQFSADQLAFVNYRHIDTAKLDAALCDVINGYSHFSLPRLWGTGKVVAADGTMHDLARENLVSEYHIRYGGYGGIAYHHVSDTYIALFSHFIACGMWEAVYILDIFNKNQSLLQPDTIHADTQGQSAPVFGLAHLLGIKLMPRIRNWKDLIFYRPTKVTAYKHLEGLFGARVDWKLIETHWQDLMQVILSIKAGKVLPSMLLRKLSTYSRKNRLYQAFRELGRVIRTIFLLQYISSPELRQQITATTNKAEGYNGFSKWVQFGGDGMISQNSPEEQEKRIKYLDLVSNALIYQNVVDLSRTLQTLKVEGHSISREDMAALSPYLTRHLKRFGDYVLDLSKEPEPLECDLEIPEKVVDAESRVLPQDSVKNRGQPAASLQ
jgi:TnpA family transposase